MSKSMVKATAKTTSNSEEEDSSMMGEYFQKYKEYKNKFGEKMFLLWQCGSFFEVYGIKKNGITANQLLEYSRILECRVVKKGKYNNQPLEMTGFTTCKPLQKYVPKLLDEGYTVVVWEEYGEEIVKKRRLDCVGKREFSLPAQILILAIVEYLIIVAWFGLKNMIKTHLINFHIFIAV